MKMLLNQRLGWNKTCEILMCRVVSCRVVSWLDSPDQIEQLSEQLFVTRTLR